MDKKIVWYSFLMSFPVFAAWTIVFVSDVWYWVRRLYFPSPYSTFDDSPADAIAGIAWFDHVVLLLLALSVFAVVLISLKLAKDKKPHALKVSYLYGAPSVLLVIVFFSDVLFTDYSSGDSLGLLYVPIAVVFIIIPICILNILLYIHLRSKIRRYLSGGE